MTQYRELACTTWRPCLRPDLFCWHPLRDFPEWYRCRPSREDLEQYGPVGSFNPDIPDREHRNIQVEGPQWVIDLWTKMYLSVQKTETYTRIPDGYWLPPEDFPINPDMDPWHQGADPWSRSPAERNQLVVPKPKSWTAGAGGWEHKEPPPQWTPGPPPDHLQSIATSSKSAPRLGGAPPKAPPPELGPPPRT